MAKVIMVFHWILGIAAGLSLILGVVFKIVYGFSKTFVFSVEPVSFLQFTAVCCLASVALSMVDLSRKSMPAK